MRVTLPFVRPAGCLSFSAIIRNACPSVLRFLVCHPRRAGYTKRKRDDPSPLPKLSHMPQWSRFSPSIFAATALVAGCGFVHDERLDGPYRLIAVDADSEMRVCYDLGDGNCIGRISETVFAVGWNSSYLVGARHPHNDKSKVEYFYLDRALDGPLVDPSVTVRGPFDLMSFEQERQRLGLPTLTRELASLK
jgi:hypothetical protein